MKARQWHGTHYLGALLLVGSLGSGYSASVSAVAVSAYAQIDWSALMDEVQVITLSGNPQLYWGYQGEVTNSDVSDSFGRSDWDSDGSPG